MSGKSWTRWGKSLDEIREGGEGGEMNLLYRLTHAQPCKVL